MMVGAHPHRIMIILRLRKRGVGRMSFVNPHRAALRNPFGVPRAGLRTYELQCISWRLPMPVAQWRLARYLLIYRCGGSAGLACWLMISQLTGLPVSFHWRMPLEHPKQKGIYAQVGVLSIMNNPYV